MVLKMDYNPVVVVLNVIIMIISFYLLFLYIKSRNIDSYFLKYNIILSFAIFLDNAFRLIPHDNSKDEDGNIDGGTLCYIQAVLLVFLDKFLLTSITIYVFLLYLGALHTSYYNENEKKIFYVALIINIGICLIITVVFMCVFKHVAYEGGICYCNGTPGKITSDTIITFVLMAINLFSLLKLLIYLSDQIKNVAIGKINDLGFGHYYTKILFMFFINGFTLLETILIINDFIDLGKYNDFIDILSISTFLVVDLVYTINEIVYKMTLKIFCINIYNKKYPSAVQRGDTLSDDFDDTKNSRTSSLSEN